MISAASTCFRLLTRGPQYMMTRDHTARTTLPERSVAIRLLCLHPTRLHPWVCLQESPWPHPRRHLRAESVGRSSPFFCLLQAGRVWGRFLSGFFISFFLVRGGYYVANSRLFAIWYCNNMAIGRIPRGSWSHPWRGVWGWNSWSRQRAHEYNSVPRGFRDPGA